MKIEMARGDMMVQSFTIEADVIPELTEIYFTVKRTRDDKKPLFQKRLGDGTIIKVSDDEFAFTIQPEDTNHLAFGYYEFDIELVGPAIKKTFVGSFILNSEITHAENEVSA